MQSLLVKNIILFWRASSLNTTCFCFLSLFLLLRKFFVTSRKTVFLIIMKQSISSILFWKEVFTSFLLSYFLPCSFLGGKEKSCNMRVELFSNWGNTREELKDRMLSSSPAGHWKDLMLGNGIKLINFGIKIRKFIIAISKGI